MNDKLTGRVGRVAAEHGKPVNAPTVTGLIVGVNPEQETVVVDIGSSTVQVTHPFLSGSAWIRAVPVPGTACTLSYNTSKSCYEFVAYAPSKEYSSKQLDQYAQRKSLYRQLVSGEIEIASSGGVAVHHGSRPVYTGQAGAVSWSHDSDRLESTVTAPTFIVRNHRAFKDRIGNEFRFGVVKRPLSNTRELYALTPPLSNPALDKYVYAYEHLVSMANDIDSPLFDHRQGEVYDDVLTPGIPFAGPALSRKSGIPLRARYRYHATIEPGGIASGKMTVMEISCLGDVDVALSELAVQGYTLYSPVGPIAMRTGTSTSLLSKLAVMIKSEIDKIAMEAGQDISLVAGANLSGSAKKSVSLKSGADTKISAGTDIKIEGIQIKVEGTNVEIHGATGLSLTGAMGKTGRPIATQPTCFISNLPLFLDPTLTA